ncbi:type VII secretion target [Mycolicibacterium fortuitum]|uniref:type VII secretion target n=1 Tax=Mycolicibacterium fortuitum TaxID=1766 RepID=UPI00096ECF62|nr:type VII secretion target [Mycolicibacterium fortuitum]
MAPTLRVDPAVLRGVSAGEESVAAAASSTGATAALGDAAGGMAGLHSADGCRFAQTVLDAANQSVSSALNDHSDKLETAAQRYEATDALFGRRLQQLSR